MANIANLAVVLTAKTAVFEKRMKKAQKTSVTFSSRLKGISRSLRSFVGIAAATVALGGLTMALRKFINVASDAEEIASKFDTVFKELAGDASLWAAEFGSSVGRADQDVKKWLSSMQDTFVPLGFARDKASELSKGIVELAVDVASFNNKLDADVIRDFQSALVGNSETVRKYGIIITEAAIKAEGFKRGLLDNKKVLSDLEKVQIRFDLILAGTTDAQGDATRTAGSYANQMKRLRANITNLSEKIGWAFLPIATKMVELLNKKLTIFEESDIDVTERLTEALKNIAKAGSFVLDVFNGIRSVVNLVVAAFQKAISDILKGVNAITGIGGELAKEFEAASEVNLGQSFEQFLGLGEAGDKIDKFFDSIEKKAKNTAASVGKSMGAAPAIAAETAAATPERGSARSIRSRFVSVSGLTAGNPMLQAATQSLTVQQEQLEVLRLIEREQQPSLL